MINKRFSNWVSKDPIREDFYSTIGWIGNNTFTTDNCTVTLPYYPDPINNIVTDIIDSVASDFYPADNYPPVNVKLHPKTGDVQFEFALAGLIMDNLEILFEDDSLTLDYSKEDNKEDEYSYLKKGIKDKSFKASYYLPSKKYDADSIEAQYKEGILTVSVQVKEEAKPKKITIKK